MKYDLTKKCRVFSIEHHFLKDSRQKIGHYMSLKCFRAK